MQLSVSLEMKINSINTTVRNTIVRNTAVRNTAVRNTAVSNTAVSNTAVSNDISFWNEKFWIIQQSNSKMIKRIFASSALFADCPKVQKL